MILFDGRTDNLFIVIHNLWRPPKRQLESEMYFWFGYAAPRLGQRIAIWLAESASLEELRKVLAIPVLWLGASVEAWVRHGGSLIDYAILCQPLWSSRWTNVKLFKQNASKSSPVGTSPIFLRNLFSKVRCWNPLKIPPFSRAKTDRNAASHISKKIAL